MMKYLASCLAAYSVAAHHPEVRAQALIRFRPLVAKVLALLGMSVAVTIASLGLGTDRKPYLTLLAWLVGGFGYDAVRRIGAMSALSWVVSPLGHAGRFGRGFHRPALVNDTRHHQASTSPLRQLAADSSIEVGARIVAQTLGEQVEPFHQPL